MRAGALTSAARSVISVVMRRLRHSSFFGKLWPLFVAILLFAPIRVHACKDCKLPPEPTFAEMKPKAEKGAAAAQCQLASIYLTARGVARDVDAAVTWLRKSAEQGYPLAQYRLGLRYERGEGVAKDKAEAYKWYHLAAKADHYFADLRDAKSKSMTRAEISEGTRRAGAFVARKPAGLAAK